MRGRAAPWSPANGRDDRAVEVVAGHASQIRGVAEVEDSARRGADPVSGARGRGKDGGSDVVPTSVAGGKGPVVGRIAKAEDDPVPVEDPVAAAARGAGGRRDQDVLRTRLAEVR